jgi:hypothetical protein
LKVIVPLIVSFSAKTKHFQVDIETNSSPTQELKTGLSLIFDLNTVRSSMEDQVFIRGNRLLLCGRNAKLRMRK